MRYTMIEVRKELENIDYGDEPLTLSSFNIDGELFADWNKEASINKKYNELVYLCYKREGKCRVKIFHKLDGYIGNEITVEISDIHEKLNKMLEKAL